MLLLARAIIGHRQMRHNGSDVSFENLAEIKNDLLSSVYLPARRMQNKIEAFRFVELINGRHKARHHSIGNREMGRFGSQFLQPAGIEKRLRCGR
jgi:hypothetical protein